MKIVIREPYRLDSSGKCFAVIECESFIITNLIATFKNVVVLNNQGVNFDIHNEDWMLLSYKPEIFITY